MSAALLFMISALQTQFSHMSVCLVKSFSLPPPKKRQTIINVKLVQIYDED